MEFVTIGAPFEDCPQFRVGVDGSGCYHPPCGMADVPGPFATLNQAAAAIYSRQWRLRLRAQPKDGSSTAFADAAPQPFGPLDAGDLPLRCDKVADTMCSEAQKEPEVLSLESLHHTPLKEPLVDSSSSSQSTKSDAVALKEPLTSRHLSFESPQHSPLKEPLAGSSLSSESTESDGLPPSKRCRISSHGSTSTIWERRPLGFGKDFYIRMDRFGLYHTYPHLGGPFRGLNEADDAINKHISVWRQKDLEMFERRPEEPYMDWMIRKSMYGPNGTWRGKCSKSERTQEENNRVCQFVQVILDTYNADQNLFLDHAYEVNAVVQHQWIIERLAWYRHFNFTTKTRGANDSNHCTPNLFFAEVMGLQGEDNSVITCCCLIDPDANGHCYGCKNDGNANMRHPSDVLAFIGGHCDVPFPFEAWDSSDSDEDEEHEVERLRVLFEGLDDPKVVASLFD